MRRIHNIEQFKPIKEAVFQGQPGQNKVIEIEVNAIGPVVVWLQLKRGKTVTKHLLGCHDGLESYATVFDADNAGILIEGEAYTRIVRGKVAEENPSGDETYTRQEKLGLYVDELGVALHRQSILQGIASQRENLERDNYQRMLERRLGELTTQIEKLQPAPAPEPDTKEEAQK